MVRLIIMGKFGELELEDLTLIGRQQIRFEAGRLIEEIDNYEDDEDDE